MENNIETLKPEVSSFASVSSTSSDFEVNDLEGPLRTEKPTNSLLASLTSLYRASAKTALRISITRQNLNANILKDFSAIIIPHDTEILDFRTDMFWAPKSSTSQSLLRQPSSRALNSGHSAKLHGIQPPDEFDWFSFDRMGKIFSMTESCEIFSAIKESDSISKLKAIIINARRAEYWACPKEQMPIFAETLLQMSQLTKIVLRGLADDFMLSLIGKTATGLKHLDVSCSKYVTDKGIQQLFFQTVKENSALYIIPTWIQKNMDSMWPLIHTIEHLDFSWTSVTALARKMINLFPGNYIFKRHFAVAENEAFGHNIFIRKSADLITTIKQKDTKFQADLHSFAGRKGVSSFMKLIESHPWKNCRLEIFQYPCIPSATDGGGNNIPTLSTISTSVSTTDQLDDSVSVGIITPSKDEKRIQGLVTFWLGNLSEIYSIFPFNINQLGMACQKLRILSGTITDTWRNHGALLPCLTEADMFGEPDSILSLINSCPSLKKLRIRIIKNVLTDDALINALSLSMSNRYLEELWIAPGSYKKSSLLSENPRQTDQGSQHSGSIPLSANSSVLDESEKFVVNSGTQLFHTIVEDNDEADDASTNDPRVEDLVQLSVNGLRRLVSFCKKLNRIGNLSWWKITDEELEDVSNELAKCNSGINLLWDNILISGSGNGTQASNSSSTTTASRSFASNRVV